MAQKQVVKSFWLNQEVALHQVLLYIHCVSTLYEHQPTLSAYTTVDTGVGALLSDLFHDVNNCGHACLCLCSLPAAKWLQVKSANRTHMAQPGTFKPWSQWTLPRKILSAVRNCDLVTEDFPSEAPGPREYCQCAGHFPAENSGAIGTLLYSKHLV